MQSTSAFSGGSRYSPTTSAVFWAKLRISAYGTSSASSEAECRDSQHLPDEMGRKLRGLRQEVPFQ